MPLSLPLMHLHLLSTEGVSKLKAFHCLISIMNPLLKLCFVGIIQVFPRKGKFFTHLFVVSVGKDDKEELVGLLGAVDNNIPIN